MIQMLPAVKAIWGFAKPFLPWIIAGLAFIAWGQWKEHVGHKEGYAEAEKEYQAAVLEASSKFMRELRARDEALADAQGQVVEIVKWRTRTETIYKEAVKNDADCAAWASGRIACPLGLSGAAGASGHGVPSDSKRPDG